MPDSTDISSSSSGYPDQDDQAFLDHYFDQAVDAFQRGVEISLADLPADKTHLHAALDRLTDLARAVCGCPHPRINVHGYTILSELGRGGMAVVYLARQEKLGGRPVALKILPPHIAASPSARARFRSEVLSVAKQRHPGIVPVYDIVEQDGTLAYVMEWIDGRTLAQIIECLAENATPIGRSTMDEVGMLLDTTCPSTGPLAETDYPRFIAGIVAAVARALSAVHSSGVLHRDVKPSNILIRRDGVPLLSDFGLARDAASPRLTVAESFLGTMAYASPEQLRGDVRIDERSDIYSLGATLFHALLLRLPTNTPTPQAALAQIADGKPIAMLRQNPEVPPALADVIAKAMARDPARRHASATELATELEDYVRNGPTATRPRRIGTRPARAARWLLWGGSGGLLTLAAGYAIWSTWGPSASMGPTRLSDPSGGREDLFGFAVAGWGDRMLVTSKTSDGGHTSVGAADIYRRSSGSWVVEARLGPPPESVASGLQFGEAAVLSDAFAVITAPGEMVDGVHNSGAAYLFHRIETQWSLVQRIKPAPLTPDSGFGSSVALCGDLLIVGTEPYSKALGSLGPGEPGVTPAIVSVYRVGMQGATLLQALYPTSLRFREHPGVSCDIAAGGDLILIGAGFSHAPTGEVAGNVFVYMRADPSVDHWTMIQTITPADGRAHDNFGLDVKAFVPSGLPSVPANTHLAVGWAAREVGGVQRAGRVLLFSPSTTTPLSWNRAGELLPPRPSEHGLFGMKLAAWQDTLAVFHKEWGLSNRMQCRVGLYTLDHAAPGLDWRGPSVLQPEIADEDDFGWSLTLWPATTSNSDDPTNGLNLLAGARYAASAPPGTPAAYHRGTAWFWQLPRSPGRDPSPRDDRSEN